MQPAVIHPETTQVYPITQGYVISQNPDTGTLAVMMRDGQILSQVPVLYLGACDALRVDQKPLPGKGTVGVLLLVNCDINSAVWLGSVTSTLTDALSSTSDAFVDYQSHWSGFWRSMDSSGSMTATFPDGTEVVVGSAYSPVRHTVSSAGQRQAIPFTAADRVASTPAHFPITIVHSSGATVTIAAAGAVTIHAAAGQALQGNANGGVVDIDGSGNIAATSPGTITVSGSSNVTVESATSLTLKAPQVYGTNGGTTQELVTQTAWSWIIGHTHPDPQGGNTGTPNSVPSVGVLTTTFEAE